eukprot:13074639-Heterocapsa_arctica.AAC.1
MEGQKGLQRRQRAGRNRGQRKAPMESSGRTWRRSSSRRTHMGDGFRGWNGKGTEGGHQRPRDTEAGQDDT